MNDIGIGIGINRCHKHKTSNIAEAKNLILMQTDGKYFKAGDKYVALEKPNVQTAKTTSTTNKIDKSYWNL